MKEKVLSQNIINATKWSTITEILAKLVVPVTNMILARLLTPEAFGVVATITMIISFADMFTDSGFQKYLIQHEFINKEHKQKSINVAFWTNLFISVVLWISIILFSEKLAEMVGNPGLGIVLAISGISLPLTSFSSIQMAIYRREFDYKTLFNIRIINVFIPFFITIPLAMLGVEYWALIIGNIVGNLCNAVLLTVKSKWRPKLYYDMIILKEMISFSIWSLLEAISIWLTSYIGTFIIGGILNSYYLGLYKTTITTINGILAIITTATTSILFSSLSRVQNDNEQYEKIFFKFIKLIAMIILPMGVGIFIYREFITDILLGKQWGEASEFAGIWGIMSSITIVFGQYCSEVYRSKGRPKLSFLVQFLHLIVLIPVMAISAKIGFKQLTYARSLIKIHQILINWIVVYFVFKISPIKMIKTTIAPIIASFFMMIVAIILQSISNSYIWTVISIIICVITYLSILIVIPNSRNEIIKILKVCNLFTKNKK